MGILYGKLKIELMSDLCVGSGYSYAGVIDSDVSYDEYGLPYIPARRLKGCMREAAELVCPDTAEKLFGKTGDNGTKGIVLQNAYIEEYDSVAEELGKLHNTTCGEASYLSQQNILKMYTGIRAQTKLCQETGTAEKNTLRYTRIVGQYDPLKGKVPLCFYAKLETQDTYREALERIVKAVRNIGMNRNRGLGSVRCSLVGLRKAEGMEQRLTKGTEGEERVCLTYVLYNREPLLMSSDNAEVSDSYISGKSVLGKLAGAYLRGEGRSADGEEFRQLFLDGNTLFTNAYPTVPPKKDKESAVQWPDYDPAPLYLNRLKKTGVLINLLGENKEIPQDRRDSYDTGGGNLPKKLKTHYVHERSSNIFDVIEPQREILYHNSQRELLYSLEAVKEGQYFKGQIYTSRKYADLLKELLEHTHLSFGKSKTAQYGICELAAGITVEVVGEDTICAEGGERIAVVMDSDTVFIHGADGYTVKFEEIKELVGEQLEIPYDKAADESSMLQTKEITGYNTTWNLRRPGIPAVKAGSVLVYTIPAGQNWKKNVRPDRLFTGERNLEGYGQVRIVKCRDMSYVAGRTKDEKDNPAESLRIQSCKPFLLQILTEQLLERLVFLYTGRRSELNLTASTVGRMGLMLQESLNEYRDDSEKAFKDFCSRVESIKRKREKEEAFRFLHSVLLKERETEEEGEYRLDIRKMTENKGDWKLEETESLLKSYSTEDEYRQRLTDIWGVYMENLLTFHKYRKKHEA